MYTSQHNEEQLAYEYGVVLPMYELKQNEGMNKELRKAVNAKYVVRFTDCTGHVSLIGAGQLHKKIGAGGVEIAEDVSKEALEYKGSVYTKDLDRGIRIQFTKRKNNESN